MKKPTPEQKVSFESWVLDTALYYASLAKTPYGDQTPAQISDTFEEIDRAISCLLSLLRPIRVPQGKSFDEPPYYNWKAATLLQMMHYMVHLKKAYQLPKDKRPASIDIGVIPGQIVAELDDLQDTVRASIAHLKPGRGNDSARRPDTASKSLICEAALTRYLEVFGELPASTKDGWVSNALSQAFESAGLLPANGDYWLRRTINQRKSAKNPSASNRTKK